MDLRRLRYFVAVVEEGNIHRAAERLHIVQSALSRRIVELEAELRVPLLERLPRGVRASPAGEALLQHARRILGQVDQATEHMRQIACGEPGRLRLGLTPLSGQLPGVPRAIRLFRQKWPEVALQLVPLNSECQLQALKNRDIDVGLRYHRPEDPDIGFLVLQSHTFVVALPSTHALAGRAQLRAQDIANEDFIGFPREHDPVGYDKLLTGCLSAGLMPRFVQEAHSEETRLGLVSVGLGLTIVNATIRNRRAMDNVVFKAVVDLPLCFELCITWSGCETPAAQALTHYLEKELGSDSSAATSDAEKCAAEDKKELVYVMPSCDDATTSTNRQ